MSITGLVRPDEAATPPHTHSLIPTPDEWVILDTEVIAGRYGQPNYRPSEPVKRCLRFMQECGAFRETGHYSPLSYVQMLSRLNAIPDQMR